jgi:hypothetical protein
MRGLSKRKRRRITAFLALQDGLCWWCAEPVLVQEGEHPRRATIEHLQPRGHGGTNGIENLVISCFVCNGARGCQRWDTHERMIQTTRFRLLGATRREIAAIVNPKTKWAPQWDDANGPLRGGAGARWVVVNGRPWIHEARISRAGFAALLATQSGGL